MDRLEALQILRDHKIERDPMDDRSPEQIVHDFRIRGILPGVMAEVVEIQEVADTLEPPEATENTAV